MNLKVFLLTLGLGLQSWAFASSNNLLSDKNKFIFGTKSSKQSVDKSVTYDVTFEKDKALNHLLLLTTAGISTGPAPTGHALASKIVFFEQRDSLLYLFESTEGKLVTNSVDSKKFLTSFPIIKEDEKFLTVDFGKGMSSIIVKDGMYSSDGGPSEETLLQVTSSFLDRVELRGEFLFIDQYVQFLIPGTKEFGDMHLKFTFSSYTKNEQFKPKKSIGLSKLGFFETHPQYNLGAGPDDQDSYTNVLKFSINNPITYYITKNIPPEFKQAVIDGILYWNTVFGKKILKVEELPDGISVHEPGYNIVQWLDWDTAGFAYADIQANPISGEILQTHVYMTSSFAKGGLRTGKEFLKKLFLTNIRENRALNTSRIGLKGFQSAQTCEINLENFINTEFVKIEKLIQEKGEEDIKEIVQRFASDYVREVLAHEVGHTLGLRHNFAGSVGTNISIDEYEKISNLNFLTGTIPESLYPSTSVMDYTQIFTASMIGSIIRNKSMPLPYDKAAISWAYNKDVKLQDLEIPLFCTDSSNGDYQDCKVWDHGSNPILFANYKWKEVPELLSFSLFSELEEALKRGREIGITLKILGLSPEGNARWMTGKFLEVVKNASPEATYLTIRKKYPNLSALNQNVYLEDTRELQNSTFTSLGGLAKVLFGEIAPNETLNLPVVKNISDKFFFYVDKMNLDEEKREAITSFYKKYFSILEREFLLNVAIKGQEFTFNIRDNSWLDNLLTFGTTTIFSESNTVLTSSDGKEVLVPFFEYQSQDKDLRSELIKFVGSNFYPETPSYTRNSNKLTNGLVAEFIKNKDKVIGEKPISDLSDPVYDWYVSEIKRFLPIMPKMMQMEFAQMLSNM